MTTLQQFNDELTKWVDDSRYNPAQLLSLIDSIPFLPKADQKNAAWMVLSPYVTVKIPENVFNSTIKDKILRILQNNDLPSNMIAVDKGALTMALNVLSRGTPVQQDVGLELKQSIKDIR